MRNSLADVVSAALRVLDAHGLENCSMRRVAAELDVRPSALYHHVADKQTLLALMADEIVRGAVVGPATSDARLSCLALRDALLAVRDGADVVATATAFRIGVSDLERGLARLVGADGARTLLLYTFGHAQSTQTHRQAAAFGALFGAGPTSEVTGTGASVVGSGGPGAGVADPARDLDASFDRGLAIILAGLQATAT